MATTPVIGGVECDFLKGQVGYLKNKVETWHRPGIDGLGAMVLGYGDSAFSFTAVKFGTNSDIEDWLDEIELLQGQSVSATDEWGDTHDNLVVTRVGLPKKTAARVPGNEDVECRCEIAIEGVKWF
jgi:hypothetical protein